MEHVTTHRLPDPPLWLNPDLIPEAVRARAHDLAAEAAELTPAVVSLARRAYATLVDIQACTTSLDFDDATDAVGDYTGHTPLMDALKPMAEVLDAVCDWEDPDARLGAWQDLGRPLLPTEDE